MTYRDACLIKSCGKLLDHNQLSAKLIPGMEDGGTYYKFWYGSLRRL
jgi:hypothetical protein